MKCEKSNLNNFSNETYHLSLDTHLLPIVQSLYLGIRLFCYVMSSFNADQLVLFCFFEHNASQYPLSLCTFFLYRQGFSALLNILFDYIIMHPGSMQSVALVHRWEEQVVTILFQLQHFLSNYMIQNNLKWLLKSWLAKRQSTWRAILPSSVFRI